MRLRGMGDESGPCDVLEGSDDMPAHIKASLFGPTLTLRPCAMGGHFALGTWQGIYLCEHRDQAARAGSSSPLSAKAADWRSSRCCVRTYVRALGQPEGRGRGVPESSAASTHPRRWSTDFYEVRAKCTLNRLKASRMPILRFGRSMYRGHPCSCEFCFARPTHTNRLDSNAREDFERQIVVKVRPPELVRSTRRPSWRRQSLSRSAPTPIRTNGSRAGTSSCRGSGRRCAIHARLARCSPSRRDHRDIALLKEMSDMGLFSAAFSVPPTSTRGVAEPASRARPTHTRG